MREFSDMLSEYMKSKLLLMLVIITCISIFSGLLSAGFALLIGLFAAFLLGNPYAASCHRVSSLALKLSIVGMGFGLNINLVIQTASNTFWLTLSTISVAIGFGILLGRLLKTERNTGLLITSGTAICGGSAIAAISQVINARTQHTAMAVTVVFLLNIVALYIFPQLGHWLNLSQTQFGIWAALAIHDTSSVVGAASDYGAQALQVATTAKLARALWIIPLAITASLFFREKKGKIVIPLFVFLFLFASLFSSYFQELNYVYQPIVFISKQLLVFALFLLGLGFTRDLLKEVDGKPLLLGVMLWLFLAAFSLLCVLLWY